MSDQAPRSVEAGRASVGSVPAAAWALYRRNLGLFLRIALIGYALTAIHHVLKTTEVYALYWAAWGILPAALVLRLWAGAAMIVATSARHRGLSIGLSDCFARVEGLYLKYARATVLYFLLCVTGGLILVVPGVIWATIYSLGGYAAVLENGPGGGYLRRSSELVRDSFGNVVIPAVALAVLVVAGVFMPYQLSRVNVWAGLVLRVGYWVLLWPFWTATHTVLYYKLLEHSVLPPLTRERRGTAEEVRGCLSAALGAVGLVVAIVVLAYVWMRVGWSIVR